MDDVLLGVFACFFFMLFGLGGVLFFKKSEYAFVFTSERTLRGKWLFLKNKVIDGKLTIGDGEYLVNDSKPFLLRHPLIGYVPAYFFMENNPEPMNLLKHFPKSKLTASAVKKMGKMAAVEKIMEGGKKDLTEIMLFLLIGAAMGVMLAFTLLYMGAIDVPVGVCTSNPAVVKALTNTTKAVVIS